MAKSNLMPLVGVFVLFDSLETLEIWEDLSFAGVTVCLKMSQVGATWFHSACHYGKGLHIYLVGAKSSLRLFSSPFRVPEHICSRPAISLVGLSPSTTSTLQLPVLSSFLLVAKMLAKMLPKTTGSWRV